MATLIEGHRPAGDHAARWDGRGATGKPVARGVYFGVLRFGGEKRTRKIAFIR